MEKATVPVPAAPEPRTPVPPTSITSGAAVPSSGTSGPPPTVTYPAVDSTEAAVFHSPPAFDLTNDDDYLQRSLKTI